MIDTQAKRAAVPVLWQHAGEPFTIALGPHGRVTVPIPPVARQRPEKGRPSLRHLPTDIYQPAFTNRHLPTGIYQPAFTKR
jgi:hypothetical protein